jgi:AcrR family transcriptional regulator
MCAVTRDDRRAVSVIRDAAMALFAERGTAGVSVRQIALAAGVSPSLVIHHYGSKEGLKNAVDRRVVDFVTAELEDMKRLGDEGAPAQMGELWADRLQRVPELVGYVRRLLLDGGEAADALFDRLLRATFLGMEAMTAARLTRATPDEQARAAFLLANDLAVVLLRRHIERGLGVDPLSKQGLARWSATAIDVYTRGLLLREGQQ